MKQPVAVDRRQEFIVLLVIAAGLIVILLAIIGGLFLTPRALPNWAENVLVGIASVTGLRLGDCLSSLVQLATGRQVERLGNRLVGAPSEEPPGEAPSAAPRSSPPAPGRG